jgi:iron complex outermembrane receptor protein
MAQLQRVCAGALAAALLALAGPAWARDPAPDPAPAARARPRGLESITVTARKRPEDLQETPISLTALGGRELERRSALALQDIALHTPGLRWESVPSFGHSASITLRGLQQIDAPPTVDPAVGVYLDGVYTARIAGLQGPLLDVERVEVLKGPQGTLYGRNSLGGAINVQSRRPDGSFGGWARVRLGSDARRDAEGAISLPLWGEQLALRVAGQVLGRDGFHRFVPAAALPPAIGAQALPARVDHKGQEDDGYFGRASLRWRPHERFEVLAIGYRRYVRQNLSSPAVMTDPRALEQQGIPPFLPPGSLFGGITAFADLGHHPERRSTTNLGDRDDVDALGASLDASWDLGRARLRSITGHRQTELHVRRDDDATPYLLFHSDNEHRQRQLSQELQLDGTALSERLDYTLGAFWFQERNDEEAWGTSLGGTNYKDLTADVSSWALYSQASYALSERLSLTAGVRTTHERRAMDLANFDAIDPTNPGAPLLGGGVFGHGGVLVPDARLPDCGEPSKRFGATSWLVGADYQLADTWMLYASASRGFRGGGFNGRANLQPSQCGAAAQETNISYEAGLKSEWLDRRLRLNAAVFHSKHKDIQTSTLIPGQPVGLFATELVNTGTARIVGGELEVASRGLVEGLELFGTLGVVLHRYTQGPFDPLVEAPGEDLDGDGVSGEDLGRQDAQNTPKLTYSLSARYAAPLLDLGDLSLQLDWIWQSRSEPSETNIDETRVNAHGLLNGRLAFLHAASGVELALWGRNLLDRRYNYSGIDFRAWVSRYLAPPREVGVELTWRFGSEAR